MPKVPEEKGEVEVRGLADGQQVKELVLPPREENAVALTIQW